MVKPADVNLLLSMLANPQKARKRQGRVGKRRLTPCYNGGLAGEVDERFKSHAWKACEG